MFRPRVRLGTNDVIAVSVADFRPKMLMDNLIPKAIDAIFDIEKCTKVSVRRIFIHCAVERVVCHVKVRALEDDQSMIDSR